MSANEAPATGRASERVLGTPAAGPSRSGLRASSKIKERHLDRMAIVYVRQSSPQQVMENRESRERQYALAEFAENLGWRRDRVLVIDEDQGLSGKRSENRAGFQRLLAEVSMNHVGLVLGLELSRLSRSSKDWHHLVDVCAVFNTLLGDQDGIYDASDGNDRLLLGMKGAMSEFELITLRNRLERGRINKAERGELILAVPIGYLKLPTGDIVMDPDEQAREVVRSVFAKFRELGTAWRTFRYLIDNGIQMGFRCQRGPRKGHLEWRRATLPRVLRILRHPIYAGAYAYGMRGTGRQHGGGSSWFLSPEQMRVLLYDHLPAYISWDEYLSNQTKLRQNRSMKNLKGAPREGAALLPGLVICGQCGRQLRAAYPKRKKPHYICNSHLLEGTQQVCFGLKAKELDELVAQQVLLALEPAAVELSVRAVEDVQRERERLHRHWKQRLERARHESERIERQYQAVEPENRLVARTLEVRWEESLRVEQQVREEYDRFLIKAPAAVSDHDVARIKAAAGSVTALWSAPETTAADRKEIVRCLVDSVVVHVRRDSEYVDVAITWHGGFTSQHEIVRPVGCYSQQRERDRLVQRVKELHRDGLTREGIASRLNEEGFSPPRRKRGFSKQTVGSMLKKWGLEDEMRRPNTLAEGEWWVRDLAKKLDVIPQKIYYWAKQGWVHSRRTPHNHWIVWADDDELNRLHQLKEHCSSWLASRQPALVVPKQIKC